MPPRMIWIVGLCIALIGLAVFAWWLTRAPRVTSDAVAAAYARPLGPPEGPLRVFHLGHSLVGRDMPAMLAQLADAGIETGIEAGHRYDVQLGWGTSLREHWEPDLAINGFDTENAHARYRDAHEAIRSGDYDAIVLTEMVEIRDAIKYHHSGKYLAKWANEAREGRQDVRIYLYESWPHLDDPEGWLTRLDADLSRYWEDEILLRDLAINAPEQPVRVIPAGQVMARLVRRIEALGGLDGVQGREDFFRRNDDGSLDQLHVNDLGAYVVALTHYAVLYQRAPMGLPRQLRRADGTQADAPGAALAALMQQTVWDVVTNYAKTGIAP